MKKGKFRPLFLFGVFFVSALFLSQTGFAQTIIKGKIIYDNNNASAAFVTIELAYNKAFKTMSDKEGNFHFNITEAQRRDTVVFSSVGYKTLRIPVSVALKRSLFTLTQVVNTIEGVTVFNSHKEIGSVVESVGFYRSWNHKNNGGEIGRIFNVPYKKFKIDKIRLKAGKTCDTCLLRLHIRYLNEYGQPADEIFSDSISLFVHNLSLDSRVSEFDLTPYDFTFTEKTFFVGIEVLGCGNGKKGSCAFNFAGTEKGQYYFRSVANGEWNITSEDDYSVYLKLFLRY